MRHWGEKTEDRHTLRRVHRRGSGDRVAGGAVHPGTERIVDRPGRLI